MKTIVVGALCVLAWTSLPACSGDDKSSESSTNALNGARETSFDVTVNGTKVEKEDDVVSLGLTFPNSLSLGLQSDLPDSFLHQVNVNLGLIGTTTGSHKLVKISQYSDRDPNSGSNVGVIITKDQTVSYDSQSGTLDVDTIKLSKPDAQGTVNLLSLKGSFQGSFIDMKDATNIATISGHFVYVRD